MNASFHRVPRWALRASLLLTAVIWAAAPARAGDAYWGVTAGDWNDPGNWGGGVPGNNDSAHVENGGTVEVTADTPPVQWADVSGNNGVTSTFNLSGGKFSVSSSFTVGQTAAPVDSPAAGVVHQSGGQLLTPGLVVGDMAGAVGLYHMTGGYAQAHVLYVGNFGTGQFNQMAGSTWTGEQLDVGAQGGSGVFNLSGGSVENHQVVSIGNNGTGTLNVDDIDGASTFTTTGVMYVGYYGNGTVNHTAFASAQVSTQGLYLGYTAGSHGTYNLSGAAVLNVANTNNTNAWVQVGVDGTGVFTMTGGTLSDDGPLLVARNGGSMGSVAQSGGVANATWTEVGSLPGATGNYHLSGGTLNAGGSLSVGNQGSGTFVQDAGTVNVNTLTFIGDSGHGSYTLNGGTLRFGSGDVITGTLTGSSNALVVGRQGIATFNQTGGTATGGELYLGYIGGSQGTCNLSGGNLNLIGNIIDGGGTGTLNLDGGTLVVGGGAIGVDYLNVGNAAGSHGFHTMTAGQTTTVNNSFVVGNSGAGIFTQTGGTVTTPSLNLARDSQTVGTYNLNGVLNLQGGTLSVGNGTGNFNMTGGQLQNLGTIHVGAGTANFAVPAGPLEIDGAPQFDSGGTLNVNAGRLRFNVTSGAATIGTGVTANVAAGAALELAGSVSALSSTASPASRIHIVNNSPAAVGGLIVSGTNQRVGGIDGTGDAQINAGSDLTANHIVEGALVIGGTAGSPALVTIDGSDASGNPLGQSSGFALADSLTPSSPFGAGGISSANLSSGGIELAAPSLGNSVGGSNPSSVPEPSTLVLALLAVLGVVSTQFVRHHFRCRTV
jgi:hypothetical protein